MDELAARAKAEPDAWTALSWFIGNLLVQLTTDRGLLKAFTLTGSQPSRWRRRAGAGCLSNVLDRARRSGALRADASDEDILDLLRGLSLLDETAGVAAWRQSLRFVLDGLRTTGNGTAHDESLETPARSGRSTH